MTVKTAQGENTNHSADDVVEKYLNSYFSVENMVSETEIIAFALMYIADKLDSIDTRMFHLVKWINDLEKRSE